MRRYQLSSCHLSVLAGIVLFCVVGCGNGRTDRLPLVPVRGKVTTGGVAPVDARIRFHPLDPSTATRAVHPSARVLEDGTFIGGSYVKNDGVPPGDYKLTITWEEATGKDGEMVDRWRGRYADPNKSTWQIRVEDRATELEPYEIPRLRKSP